MTAGSPDQDVMWDTYPAADRVEGEAALVVDVEGFEGPLDLLLALARTEKVDITRISILALAEQYLAFIEGARALKLELAADYLVMAAWLAYLKSRLLLPEAPGEEGPSGEELAADLAFRLRRLEAMRNAAARLANRDRLGRDVFARGAPEPVAVTRIHQYGATLHDLLSAYAVRRQERATSVVHVRARPVWSLKDAHAALGRIIGQIPEWMPLAGLLAAYFDSPEMARSVAASAFGASLELVRSGTIELRQTEAFAPLYIRDRARVTPVTPEPDNG
jgi:segregation and condensation protein A